MRYESAARRYATARGADAAGERHAALLSLRDYAHG